ncbi:SET domain-containing protein [Ramaria rubella]|nr:SET domain-containing protein [Ramaria rubella]
MSTGPQLSLEPTSITVFRKWIISRGGYIHPALRFVKGLFGMSVHTTGDLPCDSKIISCPFTLAITPESSKQALSIFCHLSTDGAEHLEKLSKRELICTYLVLHWLLEEEGSDWSLSSAFQHLPYLDTLPSADVLRTPLHFCETELSLLRATNLYGATIDRTAERRSEWERCRYYIGITRAGWENGFTWQRYLTAATYLSSRAFPSTILSSTPSLVATEDSYPILLPGVDSLNHARAHKVSWCIDFDPDLSSPTHHISLVIHSASQAHTEIFNNYGPKPNSELILGYGFSLSNNPDDTIVLKIGGMPQSGLEGIEAQRWEVGRRARGIEGIWEELKATLSQFQEEPVEWMIALEAAEMLNEMVGCKLKALPCVSEVQPETVRGDVLQMIQHYVQGSYIGLSHIYYSTDILVSTTGQEMILQSIAAFADAQRELAISKARENGMELVFEDAEADDSA